MSDVIITGKRLKDDLKASFVLDIPFDKKADLIVIEGTKRILGIGATESDDALLDRLYVDTDYPCTDSKGLFCDAVILKDNGSVYFEIVNLDEIATLGSCTIGKVDAIWHISEDENGDYQAVKLVRKNRKE